MSYTNLKTNHSEPCQCCVCRGVMCLIDHPGHSHKVKQSTKVVKEDDWDAMKDKDLIAFMEWKPWS